MRSGAISDYAQWRDRSKPNLTTIKAVAAALQFDIWFVLHSLLPGLFGSGMTPIKKKKMPGALATSTDRNGRPAKLSPAINHSD